MEFIIKISQFLLSLSLLIVLHELGHFIPAKLFKTKVEKFYLFFDVKFSLFKKKIGDTEYGIGWLPLGGYVKIAGMIDESMDKEQMALPPQPWEFRSKPAWQRLIIMLGGVTVNFILAYFIYVALSFTYGDTDVTTDSMKDGFWIENNLLLDVGFKNGDKILAINDEKVDTYYDVRKNLVNGEKYSIVRDGENKEIVLPKDFLGQLSSAERKNGTFKLRIPFMVGSVPDSSLNKGVNLEKGDILLSINGNDLRYFDEVESRMLAYKNQSVEATFLRGEEK
ncbi:Membrane-associated zinc metalloprotease [Winogradskyella psychrotolerans RS-3]|uniref:Membrane-associated zinc metalloprotease n=1 Tax=Winogradskyella psychrotolerans RS-3 TaxID=641526 RepID=S7VPT0_9FLAO|nr:Membrane-associated zinc metalloprotease [Winogradskyella psychrotolerans RS-3]